MNIHPFDTNLQFASIDLFFYIIKNNGFKNKNYKDEINTYNTESKNMIFLNLFLLSTEITLLISGLT